MFYVLVVQSINVAVVHLLRLFLTYYDALLDTCGNRYNSAMWTRALPVQSKFSCDPFGF